MLLSILSLTGTKNLKFSVEVAVYTLQLLHFHKQDVTIIFKIKTD